MPSPLIFALQSITIFWILMLNMIFFTYYNLVGFHFCGWVCHAHLSHELASGTALDLVRYGICSISMASVGSMMLTRKKCELAMAFSGSPFGFYKSVNSFLFHMHWRILAAAMPGRCHRWNDSFPIFHQSLLGWIFVNTEKIGRNRQLSWETFGPLVNFQSNVAHYMVYAHALSGPTLLWQAPMRTTSSGRWGRSRTLTSSARRSLQCWPKTWPNRPRDMGGDDQTACCKHATFCGIPFFFFKEFLNYSKYMAKTSLSMSYKPLANEANMLEQPAFSGKKWAVSVRIRGVIGTACRMLADRWLSTLPVPSYLKIIMLFLLLPLLHLFQGRGWPDSLLQTRNLLWYPLFLLQRVSELLQVHGENFAFHVLQAVG